jgi:hypothetical protein
MGCVAVHAASTNYLPAMHAVQRIGNIVVETTLGLSSLGESLYLVYLGLDIVPEKALYDSLPFVDLFLGLGFTKSQ